METVSRSRRGGEGMLESRDGPDCRDVGVAHAAASVLAFDFVRRRESRSFGT